MKQLTISDSKAKNTAVGQILGSKSFLHTLTPSPPMIWTWMKIIQTASMLHKGKTPATVIKIDWFSETN